MENFVVVIVLLAVVGLAVGYIRREKKRGVKCVGCPYANECAARRNGEGCSN